MACSNCGKNGHYAKTCPKVRLDDRCKHNLARETCAICKSGTEMDARTVAPAERRLMVERCSAILVPRDDRLPNVRCKKQLGHTGGHDFSSLATGDRRDVHRAQQGIAVPGNEAQPRKEETVLATPTPGDPGARRDAPDPALATDEQVMGELRRWLAEAQKRLVTRLDKLNRISEDFFA